jgi:hypothetical protein
VKTTNKQTSLLSSLVALYKLTASPAHPPQPPPPGKTPPHHYKLTLQMLFVYVEFVKIRGRKFFTGFAFCGYYIWVSDKI